VFLFAFIDIYTIQILRDIQAMLQSLKLNNTIFAADADFAVSTEGQNLAAPFGLRALFASCYNGVSARRLAASNRRDF
jgi:hypothetical protein